MIADLNSESTNADEDVDHYQLHNFTSYVASSSTIYEDLNNNELSDEFIFIDYKYTNVYYSYLIVKKCEDELDKLELQLNEAKEFYTMQFLKTHNLNKNQLTYYDDKEIIQTKEISEIIDKISQCEICYDNARSDIIESLLPIE